MIWWPFVSSPTGRCTVIPFSDSCIRCGCRCPGGLRITLRRLERIYTNRCIPRCWVLKATTWNFRYEPNTCTGWRNTGSRRIGAIKNVEKSASAMNTSSAGFGNWWNGIKTFLIIASLWIPSNRISFIWTSFKTWCSLLRRRERSRNSLKVPRRWILPTRSTRKSGLIAWGQKSMGRLSRFVNP